MKVLKRIFYVIALLLILGCSAVVVIALNPNLTEKVAKGLYGQRAGEQADAPANADAHSPGENNLSELALSGETQLNDGESTSDNSIAVPPAVTGKSNYLPVQENREEVTEEEAPVLQSTVQTGSDGEDLSFDTTIYPYYGMLSEDMQKLYRQIYANAMDLNASFGPVVPVNVNQLKNVFEAVYNDHPELFWLETEYACKYLRSGQCLEMELKFNATAENLSSSKQTFEAGAQNIVAGAQGLSDDTEKEKYVHDALVESVDYDAAAPMNQSAYSALVNGKTVCAGYARAFQYLMQQLGIPCYYCTGFSGEDHAWNIVKLGEQYHNVDVTWDDTEPSTYDYFNKSDAEFAPTHRRQSLSVNLPACAGEGTGNEGEQEHPGNTQEGALSADGEDTYLINPNPIKPITWQSTWNNRVEEEDEKASAEERLAEAGITAEEVMSDMEAYYADCLEQLTLTAKTALRMVREELESTGTDTSQSTNQGSVQTTEYAESLFAEVTFSNVVPQSLWPSVEQAYMGDAYRRNYGDKALEELKMKNLAVQIQAQKLGGGYYRVYHTMVVWN